MARKQPPPTDPPPAPPPGDEADLLKLIGLEQARRLIAGRGGKPVSVETLRKWCKDGYAPKGWAGPRLFLKVVRTSTDIFDTPLMGGRV